MADEAASVLAPEIVETDVLYIRDHVLEWPGRAIQFRYVQSVSCDASELPEHPDSADEKRKAGTRGKNIGLLLCAFAALFFITGLLFRLKLILLLPLAVGTGLLMAGGVFLRKKSQTACAEAEKELEEWKAACEEADKNRRLEIVLYTGDRVQFPVGDPVFLQRVFQLLSSKLDHPEDPDRRYKIELDTGKLYRIKLVQGAGEHRRGEHRHAVGEHSHA